MEIKIAVRVHFRDASERDLSVLSAKLKNAKNKTDKNTRIKLLYFLLLHDSNPIKPLL